MAQARCSTLNLAEALPCFRLCRRCPSRARLFGAVGRTNPSLIPLPLCKCELLLPVATRGFQELGEKAVYLSTLVHIQLLHVTWHPKRQPSHVGDSSHYRLGQGYELGMFHFIAMEWPKAHEHFSCVYNSVNSDKAQKNPLQLSCEYAASLTGLLPLPLLGDHSATWRDMAPWPSQWICIGRSVAS